jgi:hypothetical protein
LSLLRYPLVGSTINTHNPHNSTATAAVDNVRL